MVAKKPGVGVYRIKELQCAGNTIKCKELCAEDSSAKWSSQAVGYQAKSAGN
ncbi:hypothetical protein D3C87_1406890 [compost metagenome]